MYIFVMFVHHLAALKWASCTLERSTRAGIKIMSYCEVMMNTAWQTLQQWRVQPQSCTRSYTPSWSFVGQVILGHSLTKPRHCSLMLTFIPDINNIRDKHAFIPQGYSFNTINFNWLWVKLELFGEVCLGSNIYYFLEKKKKKNFTTHLIFLFNWKKILQ